MAKFSIRRCTMLLGIVSIPLFALLGLFAGDGNDRIVLYMSLLWIAPLLAVLAIFRADPAWIVLPSSLVAALPILYAVGWLFLSKSARDSSTAHLAPLFLFTTTLTSLFGALALAFLCRGFLRWWKAR